MTRASLILVALAALLPTRPLHAEPGHAGPKGVGPDVPPELPAEVHRKRRERLMKDLGKCVGALKSHTEASDFGTQEEPDQDFLYLTGVWEGGALLVLAPQERVFKQVLHLRPRDEELEIVDGYREPMSDALRGKYLVDAVSRLWSPIPRRLRTAFHHSDCFASLRAPDQGKEDFPAEGFAKLAQAFDTRLEQRWRSLEAMRAVKDPDELQRMRKAIAITIEGHRAAALHLAPGLQERQVAARIDEAFYRHGATGLAFASIVGSGEDGAIWHWAKNDRTLRPDDLVVVDIGASYGHYASDLTRTLPVAGRFSPEQRKVYEAVLAAQEKAIGAVRPGISLDELHVIAREQLRGAGYELKHYVGHYVGLDVHDVGDTGAPLRPGMVITIEPGVYLKDRFGVRIEDEVLVTEKGHELLSAALPRSVADVEAWMAKVRAAP